MQKDISDIVKRRGIIYPSFEVYGGAAGFYDYGPVGVRIKKNLEKILREAYVIDEGCMEVECPTLSPQDVWVASGHVTSFTDVMAECLKCGEPYKLEQILTDVGEKAYGTNITELKGLLDEKGVDCPKCKGEAVRVYYYHDTVNNEMFEAYRSKPNPDVTPSEEMAMPQEMMLYKMPGGKWTTAYPEKITSPKGISDWSKLEYCPPTSEKRQGK